MKYLSLAVSILVAALLSACGGGGSSSGSSKPAATVSITASNADQVAKSAMTANSSAQTGTTTANTAKAAGMVADGSNPQSAMNFAINRFFETQNLTFPASNTTKAVSGYPKTYNCSTSGTYQVDITDADNSGTFTVGDSAVYTYTDCVAGTVTTKGSFSLKVNSYSSPSVPTSSNPESVSATLTYNNLSVATAKDTVTFNGDMTLSFTYDGTTVSASLSGSSYTVSSVNAGSVTFSNFSFKGSVNATTWTSSVDLTIKVTPTGGTEGTINISTPTAFSGAKGGNPTSGQMKIEGANGTYIIITANADGVHADIEIYDGTTKTTKQLTWDQL